MVNALDAKNINETRKNVQNKICIIDGSDVVSCSFPTEMQLKAFYKHTTTNGWVCGFVVKG